MQSKHSSCTNQIVRLEDSDIDESDSVSMSKPDCPYCGVLFRDEAALSEHMDKCNEEEESDDSDCDESVWEDMVQEAYDKHAETYQSKIDTYEEEGMSQDDAQSRANDDMHRTYKKDIMSSYKRLLIQMNDIELSAYHKKFMCDIDRFECRGYTHKKAIKASLKRNSHLFDQILNELEPDSDDDRNEDDEADAGSDAERGSEDDKEENEDDDDELPPRKRRRIDDDEEPPRKRRRISS